MGNNDSSDQTTEGLLYQFLNDLASEKEYRFSSPWRPRGSLSVVVPIIATSAMPHKRDYVMLQESRQVEVTDTGQIGGISATNRGDIAVFVRVGSIFKGNGTQSRAVNKSLFIEPGEAIDVNVNCVHASHPIDPRATFSTEKEYVAPAEVERALYAGVQQEVWDLVRHYSSTRSRISRAGPTMPADNMIGSLSSRDKFSEMIDEVIRQVPNHEGQVGIAIIDESGVYGLEMFDSPESWKALGKKVVAKYSEKLVNRLDEKEGKNVVDVKVNLERAHDAVIEFIGKLSQKAEMGAGIKEVVFSNAGRVSIRGNFIPAHGDGIHGELIFRSDKFVHLVVSRATGVAQPRDITRLND